MKKLLGILILALLFLLNPLPCFAHPFKVGEELHYIIKLIGIPAGSQVLKVEEVVEDEGDSLYALSSEVESFGVVSLFFQMEDKIKSYVDTETLYPRLVKINIRENSRIETMEVRIENEDSKIKAIIWNKKEEKKWTKELSIPPLDILSLIYWIRTQDLEVGRKFEVLLLDTPGNFKSVEFEVSGVDKAYTYLGVFPAFICQQIGVKNGIKVWFSKDERHLPLYIQINTPLGFLTAILQEVN